MPVFGGAQDGRGRDRGVQQRCRNAAAEGGLSRDMYSMVCLSRPGRLVIDLLFHPTTSLPPGDDLPPVRHCEVRAWPEPLTGI